MDSKNVADSTAAKRPSGAQPAANEAAESEAVPDQAHELSDALARMTWREMPERFALLGCQTRALTPELLAEFARGAAPRQLIREAEGWTLLVSDAEAENWLERLPGARCTRPWVWLRFDLPMAWDLVGFLAHVTGLLAREGVSVGAICGYDRDHLIISAEQRDAARSALERAFGPETIP